jgi:hypothetical protein
LSTRTIGLGLGLGDASSTHGDNQPVARSVVRLPPDVRSPFEVYVNGVPQRLGDDYSVQSGALVFDRELRKDRISGWRWFLGAWGVGTYRQDDSVDVRYERPDGSPAVAEKLDIETQA